MAMIGPSPIETVGYSQKSGISQGCGYDERPPSGLELAAEVLEVRLVDPPFEVRARVDAGRRMPLKEDDVAVAVAVVAAEEMIEGDLVQRRRRGIGRDVAADALFGLVRADHHRQRIPADQALDPPLDVRVAGHRHLLVGRNAC